MASESIILSGIILAGGLGRRVNGADKGLLSFNDKPLVSQVLSIIKPQVDDIHISCNRNLDLYRRYADHVHKDKIPDFLGPLAGIHSCLIQSKHEYAFVLPCDCPSLPSDVAKALSALLTEQKTQIAVARDSQQLQPLIMVVAKQLGNDIEKYLTEGGRSVKGWLARHPFSTLDIAEGKLIKNLNTPSDIL